MLLKMLPAMVKYVSESRNYSILSRIYGIYTVEMPGVEPVDLMVQKNNNQINENNKIFQIFDLKGSTFKRQVIEN